MLCIAGAVGVSAQHSNVGRHILVVNTVEGEPVEFAFQTDPIATIEGAELVITDINDERILYPIADLVNLTFKIDPNYNSVEGVGAEATTLRVSLTRTAVIVSGLEPGVKVALYAAEGVMAAIAGADADGVVTLSTEALPKGVYSVAAPGHPFKFIK